MSVELPVLDLTAASMHVYMSPFHDTKQAYLDFIASAKRSIHVNIFGFHIPELTAALIAKRRAGVKVDVILDHSQAQGKAEAPELLKLMRAGVPILIGTSPRSGQLLHLKATVVDEASVECGSWNYSDSASDQLNDLQIIEDPRLAQFYLLAHDIIRAYIVRHERIFQPRAETPMEPALAQDVGQDAQLDPAPDAGQVHRKDVAAPWLDNATLPDATKAATPRVRKRAVRQAKAG